MAKRTRANPFSIAVIAILLAIIGVLSWRLEKTEAKPDVSPTLSANRPALFSLRLVIGEHRWQTGIVIIAAVLSLTSCEATRASPCAGQPNGVAERHYMAFAPGTPYVETREEYSPPPFP